MILPQIQTCNMCGECCRKGGECTYRGSLGWKFTGTCVLLISMPDGTTRCQAMINMQTYEVGLQAFKADVKGICDFPEYRKEIDNGSASR